MIVHARIEAGDGVGVRRVGLYRDSRDDVTLPVSDETEKFVVRGRRDDTLVVPDNLIKVIVRLVVPDKGHSETWKSLVSTQWSLGVFLKTVDIWTLRLLSEIPRQRCETKFGMLILRETFTVFMFAES